MLFYVLAVVQLALFGALKIRSQGLGGRWVVVRHCNAGDASSSGSDDECTVSGGADIMFQTGILGLRRRPPQDVGTEALHAAMSRPFGSVTAATLCQRHGFCASHDSSRGPRECTWSRGKTGLLVFAARANALMRVLKLGFPVNNQTATSGVT